MKLKLVCAMFVAVTLMLLTEARAFYDPGLQRWLNRDPILEHGGLNLFGFVRNAPPSSIDPHGLVLKIDPTSPPDFQKRMMECLRELINKSPYGLDLVREAIDSPQIIKITPFDGGAACAGSVRSTDPEDQNPAIGMHPTSPNGASQRQQRGMEKCGEACPKNTAGCAIILAHELSHAVYDYSEAQAVVYAENPVRRDFGVPLRTTYHCKGVYPPDFITRSGK